MGLDAGNGWERWRGGADAKFNDLENSMKALLRFKEDGERRISILETKMVVFAALAAAIGAMLPGVVSAIVKQL